MKDPHYPRPEISLIYQNLPGYGVDLYVGGREGASDVPLLQQHGISTVVNCAVNLDFNYVGAPIDGVHDSRVDYGPAPIRYYKLGMIDGPGNPETMMLAGYYLAKGALDQIIPEKASYPVRTRGNMLINCRAGRSRSVALAGLILHKLIPQEFPTLADALQHVREKRELRPDEWYETPKPMLVAAAERTATWISLVEADRAAYAAHAAATSKDSGAQPDGSTA